jgi:hypothetical protein
MAIGRYVACYVIRAFGLGLVSPHHGPLEPRLDVGLFFQAVSPCKGRVT